MKTKEIWKKRVEAWKSSGRSSEAFCEGRGFSAGLLRHWAWRLGLTESRAAAKEAARPAPAPLARVVWTRRPEAADGAQGSIRIEIGRARVEVRSGFDAATLAAVVAVLEGRVGATEIRS